jgi:hypothetical protein
MEAKSKIEDLKYRLNFFDAAHPNNRMEIPITFQQSLEFTGYMSCCFDKPYLEKEGFKIWVTAQKP